MKTLRDYINLIEANQQGVAEGAPELLKAEMPLVRHIEQELTKIGYKKGTPEFNAYFNDAIKFYRQFGNFGFNKNQGVAEGSLEEYGDTAKGQKQLAKVHKRAVDRVTSKQADTDPKYAKKNQDTANASWERLKDKD